MLSSCFLYFFLLQGVYSSCKANTKGCKADYLSEHFALVQRQAAKLEKNNKPCPDGYDLAPGVFYWATHRDKTSPSTVDACGKRCDDEGITCVAFSRASATRNCWLYSKMEEVTSGTSDDGVACIKADPTPTPTSVPPTLTPTSAPTTPTPTSAPTTPTPTPAPPSCTAFCANHYKPWTTKCQWTGCSLCSDCLGIEVDNCKSWCAASENAWDLKCTWDGCKECEGCHKELRWFADSESSNQNCNDICEKNGAICEEESLCSEAVADMDKSDLLAVAEEVGFPNMPLHPSLYTVSNVYFYSYYSKREIAPFCVIRKDGQGPTKIGGDLKFKCIATCSALPPKNDSFWAVPGDAYRLCPCSIYTWTP